MIIIIGGTGFIGKHLTINLHKLGIPATTYSRNPDKQFLKRYAPSIQGIDIDHIFNIEHRNLLEDATMLIYLASSSTPISSGNSLVSELEKNVSPAIKLLDQIVNINPRLSILFLSSGGTVYGAGHNEPISEAAETKPSTPYAFGKITLENYLAYINATVGNSYAIVRASNPIGEWHKNHKQGFIGTAIKHMSTKTPITVYGDGSATRDYFHANDLCTAIVSIIKNKEIINRNIWNVGSGIGMTINEVITLLEKTTNITPIVEYLPERGIDLNYNVLNCSKIQQELGWECQTNISDAIERIWKNT